MSARVVPSISAGQPPRSCDDASERMLDEMVKRYEAAARRADRDYLESAFQTMTTWEHLPACDGDTKQCHVCFAHAVLSGEWKA